MTMLEGTKSLTLSRYTGLLDYAQWTLTGCRCCRQLPQGILFCSYYLSRINAGVVLVRTFEFGTCDSSSLSQTDKEEYLAERFRFGVRGSRTRNKLAPVT